MTVVKSRLPPHPAKPGTPPRRTAKHATAARRPPTRGDEVIELLRRRSGASIEEMVARFGIQPHSIRAVISVESRKRALNIEMPERGRYRIVP